MQVCELGKPVACLLEDQEGSDSNRIAAGIRLRKKRMPERNIQDRDTYPDPKGCRLALWANHAANAGENLFYTQLSVAILKYASCSLEEIEY